MTVWDDINRMKTLNTSQSQRRKQMHVCPLQIDIVGGSSTATPTPATLWLTPLPDFSPFRMKRSRWAAWERASS